jgi:hypothetical protein
MKKITIITGGRGTGKTMKNLQNYLKNIDNLIQDNVLTPNDVLEAFKSGLQGHFDKRTIQDTTVDMAITIDSWVQKNFFRQVYSRNYSLKQDGTGCYSYDELVEKYEKGEDFPSTEKLSFFDWLKDNTTRPSYSCEYLIVGGTKKRHTFDELVEIYSKFK